MKDDSALTAGAESALLDAIRCRSHVSGHTHQFYRYPARFSPIFVREVIRQYSRPGDVVLDPFMGGGTTAVETLALGRRAIGVDINELAHFVATVKTTPLHGNDSGLLRDWALGVRSPQQVGSLGAERVSNFPWRMQRFAKEVLNRCRHLPLRRQRAFVRSALLKTIQEAADCTVQPPPSREVRAMFVDNLFRMLKWTEEFITACDSWGMKKSQIRRNRLLLSRSAAGLENDPRLKAWPKARLVLTSPPYPSVHILYHRWQVGGRRETAAPYWIAGVNDGRPGSHYTFGGRSTVGLDNYFRNLENCFRSVRLVIHRSATVVQMVAFSDPPSQLARYLAAMEAAGYREFSALSGDAWPRAWRQVPNRKWYCHDSDGQHSAQEVVLFHRPR